VRTRPWEVSDELWARVEPHIPPERPKPKGGRPRMADRAAFGAIVYVLRTGIQWNALPRELGASSTVHARFQEWVRESFFGRLHAAGLTEYDELSGIDWEWQAADGAMGKAPLVPKGDTGAAAGPNPTDRGKRGTKRSLLVDGNGIPLAVAIDGANRHDSKLLGATLDGLVVLRPEPDQVGQHLCLDKGYDFGFVREEAEARGYRHHIRGRGEERAQPHPDGKARRWVVERTISWLNHSRRLLIRWEKKAENHLALIHLACAQLIFAKLGF
jgi:putative transposase